MTFTNTGYKSLIDFLPVITITKASYSRKVLNLAKTYINKAKYSGQNDISTFDLKNVWKNALNSISKNFCIHNTSKKGLYHAIK